MIQVFARKQFKRQVVYIPNGAQPQTVTDAGELAGFGLEPQGYLLNVSRLVPHKGQHYLIEAYKRLPKTLREQYALTIVGAPAYTEEYLTRLKDLAGGDPNILFLGYQSGEALAQLFAHAALFIQPSESEGLPVVVLEAMSYGTPVLVSDIAENLEVIHHAGFSFKTTDVDDLTAKLEELIQNPDRLAASGGQARDVIRRYFSWDAIAQQTEEVYRTVRH